MAHIIGNSQNFQTEVLDFSGQVIVDFWASWCGPCQMLTPVLEEIAQDRPEVKIVKVDVDSEPSLASKYNVSSIPHVLIFKNGQIIDTLIGFRQKQDYLSALAK